MGTRMYSDVYTCGLLIIMIVFGFSLFFYGCFWLLLISYEFFLLRAGSIDVLRIMVDEYNFTRKLTSIDSKESGDMMCISKNRVLRVDQYLDVFLGGDDIFNCFTDDGVLHIAYDSFKIANTTTCYFEGHGIISKDHIPERGSTAKDRAVCKLGHGSRTVLNKFIPSCTYLSDGSFGSFYTDFDKAKIIEEEELAACIVEVSTGVTIFLASVWFIHGFYRLLPFCLFCCYEESNKKATNKTVLCIVICLICEVVVLVMPFLLPFLYRSKNLHLSQYYLRIVVTNIIIFVCTAAGLIRCILRGRKNTVCDGQLKRIMNVMVWNHCCCITTALRNRQQVRSMNQVRLVPGPSLPVQTVAMVWKHPPLTTARSREIVLDVNLLTEIDVHAPSTCSEENNAVRNLTLSLWNSNRVGIGRDASGLHHKNIEIIAVRKMETSVSSSYLYNKIILQGYASRRPCEDIKLDYKDDPDILTRKELATNSSVLKRLVNDSINEVYLFHGTKAANISSIEQTGFDVQKCQSAYLGKGLYFAESPVKSDQYSDRPPSDVCTMILARVLLGNTIVLKDGIYMGNSLRPPCSTCLAINCTERHAMEMRPFDSVILDKPGGLFREFVVYDNGMAHPAYHITYRRVQ